MTSYATLRLACFGAAVALAAAAGACTEVPSDPNTPVAIEWEPTQLPAIVLGDSLRDTAGLVVPLTARALNSDNRPIEGAPIRFAVLHGDTDVVSVDSLTGRVFGRDTGQATVTAHIGGLQADIPVRVTLRPDTLVALDSLRDTLEYSPIRETTDSVRVRVAHRDTSPAEADTLVPVAHYVVRFAIVAPDLGDGTDTTRVFLANDARRPSRLDTTDASGVASRRIRITIAAANNVPPPPDSVVVEASARRPDGAPVPGSPVRFVVHLRRQTGAH